METASRSTIPATSSRPAPRAGRRRSRRDETGDDGERGPLLGPDRVASPPLRSRWTTESRMIISPSRALNVPSPKSPRSSSVPRWCRRRRHRRAAPSSGSPGNGAPLRVAHRPSAQGARSRATSSWRTEWVRQPAEIRSTPVSATARTVSGVMPPDASTRDPAADQLHRLGAARRAACCRAARRRPRRPAPRRAGRGRRPRPRSSPGGRRAARTRAIAVATPPAAATWLSLISTASSRPKRWLAPPPQRTAYFSRARSPGVVLRVQTMRGAGPLDAAHHVGGGGGDAAQPAEQVEAGALAGEQRPGRAGDRGQGRCRPRRRRRRRRRAATFDVRGQQSEHPGRRLRARRPGPPGGRRSRPVETWSAGTMASVVRSPARPRSSRQRRSGAGRRPARRAAGPSRSRVGPSGGGPGRAAAAVRSGSGSIRVCRAQAVEVSGKSRRWWAPRLSRRARAARATSGRR